MNWLFSKSATPWLIAVIVVSLASIAVGCSTPTEPTPGTPEHAILTPAFEGTWASINTDTKLRFGNGIMTVFSGSVITQQKHYTSTTQHNGIYELMFDGENTPTEVIVRDPFLMYGNYVPQPKYVKFSDVSAAPLQ